MRKHILAFALLLCAVAVNAQSVQEWCDSVSVLSKMIEQNPRSLELRMRKAEANVMLEQWKYALDEYSSILDLHPGHIGALYFRAYVNNKLRRYAFARLDYEAVLKYEPTHKGALTGLIMTDIADGQLKDAYDLSEILVELYPDDPMSYEVRGESEEAKGMNDFAILDFTKAIELEMERMRETNAHASIDDTIVTYILRKVSLQKNMKDEKGIQASIDLLMKLGIPGTAAKALIKRSSE